MNKLWNNFRHWLCEDIILDLKLEHATRIEQIQTENLEVINHLKKTYNPPTK